MKHLVFLYQHLPEKINPMVISILNFSISWYSLMYAVGFLVVYQLLVFRIKRNEFHLVIGKGRNKASGDFRSINEQKKVISELLIVIFLGLLVGARLGYVIFYNLRFYIADPLAIISPFDSKGEFIGIFGMSYHGGLIGTIFAASLYCRKKGIGFMRIAEFILPAVPAGYFFGRIGNFINGELYGRPTDKPWGMYFPNDPFHRLRHPSQLYEAFLEGFVLFVILWSLRNRKEFQKNMLSCYLALYAMARIVAEFFREPDEQIGYLFGSLTLGQILSLSMLISAVFLYFFQKRKKDDIMYR